MLKLESISYHIDEKDILSSVDITVFKGEHLLIHGSSGCGKTTLMHIMAGLLLPTSGEVSFNQYQYGVMKQTEIDAIRGRHFGFVFQKLHLINHLTVEQNIAMVMPTVDKNRIQNILSDLGLGDKLHQTMASLSVGEAQRVAVARAIIHSPDIIFADEPTSALDDVNAVKTMELLFEKTEKTGATLIVTTHDARIKGLFKNTMEMGQ